MSNDGQQLQTLKHGDFVHGVQFFLDGDRLFSGVRSVSFSPDGKRLAAAGNEGKMKVRDIASEEFLLVDHGDGFISSVDFSPDGQILATAGGDRKVKLWNLDGEVLQSFDHGNFVNSLMFSPTEPVLVTAADDGVVKFWDLDHSNIIERS